MGGFWGRFWVGFVLVLRSGSLALLGAAAGAVVGFALGGLIIWSETSALMDTEVKRNLMEICGALGFFIVLCWALGGDYEDREMGE